MVVSFGGQLKSGDVDLLLLIDDRFERACFWLHVLLLLPSLHFDGLTFWILFLQEDLILQGQNVCCQWGHLSLDLIYQLWMMVLQSPIDGWFYLRKKVLQLCIYVLIYLLSLFSNYFFIFFAASSAFLNSLRSKYGDHLRPTPYLINWVLWSFLLFVVGYLWVRLVSLS